MNALGALLWKDALSEIRGVERLPTLGLFSAAVLVTLHFAVPPEAPYRPQVAAGFLWASLVFAALFELRRSFESERRDATLDGLRAAPLDPTLLFLGKLASSFVALALLAAVLVPLVALFFGGRPAGVAPAYGVVLLALLGLLAWGTLFAAVAGSARSGELILPILLFPLIVPQTIGCVRLLSVHLAGEPVASAITGWVLLAGFDVLSLGTSILLFDYVLGE